MMKNNTTNSIAGYTAPLCEVVDTRIEGILCSSIENLGNEFDYVWGNEE
jgi:hypothetical protein